MVAEGQSCTTTAASLLLYPSSHLNMRHRDEVRGEENPITPLRLYAMYAIQNYARLR